jgi:hypothetical protein
LLTMALAGTPIHCSLGCPKRRRHQRLIHTSSPNRIPRRHVTSSTLPNSSTLDDQSMYVHHTGPGKVCMGNISAASTVPAVSTLHHAPRAPTAHSCCPMCHFPSFYWQVRDDSAWWPDGTLSNTKVPSMVHCYLLSTLWLWFSRAPSRIKLEPHTWPPPC